MTRQHRSVLPALAHHFPGYRLDLIDDRPVGEFWVFVAALPCRALDCHYIPDEED